MIIKREKETIMNGISRKKKILSRTLAEGKDLLISGQNYFKESGLDSPLVHIYSSN